MIVCICLGVSEQHVEAMIGKGARTSEDIGRACGAGQDCRACCSLLESLLERPFERIHYSAVPSD
jgi:bacterioferritin-associated ferredoxin